MSVDHRTKAGQARRQRTRDRLIEAAIMVFAARGLSGTVIDHVVQAAGVSRGTFYNYFDTIEDVLEAARVELGREVVLLVKGTVDPALPVAERLAKGLRGFIEVARQNPLFLEFTARLGRNSYGFVTVLQETSPEFAETDKRDCVFGPIPDMLVYDMLEVGTIALLRRMREGEEVDIPAFVAAMLRVAGVDFETSLHLAEQEVEIPTLPDDSLMVRGNAALAETAAQTA